jgi:hypothetical protein
MQQSPWVSALLQPVYWEAWAAVLRRLMQQWVSLDMHAAKNRMTRLFIALLTLSNHSGFCTCMKTAEITRHKQAASGIKPPSTWAVFADIYRREGIAGINKGVNAVAVRQCTNWGSRYVFVHDVL